MDKATSYVKGEPGSLEKEISDLKKQLGGKLVARGKISGMIKI